MKGVELFEFKHWKLLNWFFGATHSFWYINADTVLYTWFCMILLVLVLLPVRWVLTRKKSVARHLVISFVSSFMNLVEQSFGSFPFIHFAFITSLFIFIFTCNAIAILPWCEEPTKDLNTTLSLGILCFIYTQFWAIKTHGIKDYLKEYTTPFFLMLPLHVISKISSVLSISFRLFGNIFGGATITHIYLSLIKGSIVLETVSLLFSVNLFIALFFGLFEGFLQAFVFTILTLTYLSLATQHEHAGDH